MSAAPHDHADVVAPPPVIYAGALVVGLLLQRAFPLPFLPRPVARIIGACLIGLNFLVGVPAIVTMRRARTSLNPAEPTTVLVTSGPFRYTRNPIYLSFTILYTGIAVFANALWAIFLLPVTLVAISRGVIAREEQYLERTFGEEYKRYKTQVRRWL
jgi:protein-S-isoprenylcysteine O-methyltransferase Ste14